MTIIFCFQIETFLQSNDWDWSDCKSLSFVMSFNLLYVFSGTDWMLYIVKVLEHQTSGRWDWGFQSFCWFEV